MKTSRGASESSTTSDNTTEFIDIVRKYDVVYNTHNPDYKNVEVKMKVWSQIAEEIGLSIDASKRKWKNLRDSYTKYLRSFRTGTKTSKKYQYWAHADHMDFLKPYQGPGRTSTSSNKIMDEEDTECDLGYQVLAKASTASEDDLKITITTTPSVTNALSSAAATVVSAITSTSLSSSASAVSTNTTCTSTTVTNALTHTSAALMLPIPSLPTVQLPPQFIGRSIRCPSSVSSPAQSISSTTQIFSIPAISSGRKSTIPSVPASTNSSGVGCLILEPHLFAASSSDTFKKELSTPGFGLFHSINTSAAQPTTTTAKINPPLITKIRRVPPSQQQTSAVNLSFTTSPKAAQPPPTKARKLNEVSSRRLELDVSAVLQANRDLDANTLFFLSLAKTVRSMPTKFQSLAKMRCMRIVSDIELELENVSDCNGSLIDDGLSNGNKYSNIESPPDGSCMTQTATDVNDTGTEHFVYVMSPSRVESMIDISSDDDNTMNGI